MTADAARFDATRFDAAGRFVDAAGLRVHVVVLGDGPVLLLLHGTGASSHSFRDVATRLADRFTVVAPDLPGHARTGMPSSAGMSIDGMAASLAAMLRTMRLEPSIVGGHSAGAAIAARMTLDGTVRPRALIGLNAALVPLDGLLRVLSPMAKLMALAPGVPRLVAGLAADPRAVQRLVDGTGSTIDADGTRRYAALVRDRAHVAGAIAMMAAWNLDRTWAQLPRLAPPPLLIVGDRDRTVPPSQADTVRRHVPGAEVVVLRGLGHLAHEEAPADVAALVVGHARGRGALPEPTVAR